MAKMLRSLRLKLTILYLIAAIGLVGLVGTGAYFVFRRYFQSTTDLALKYKMAAEFKLLNLEIPPELVLAEQLWLQNNSRIVHNGQTTSVVIAPLYEEESNDEQNEEYETVPYKEAEVYEEPEDFEEAHHFEADLAAVFLIPYDASNNPILPGNLVQPPISENEDLFTAVKESEYDLRTLEVPKYGRMRLLTYQTGIEVPALLQTGRLLNDQDYLLNQYLISLVIFGGGASIFLALASWWLAGRSLGPVQKAWEQQQTFVSNASHELRTPLTLIRASADYALQNQSPSERSRLLIDILDECDYMDDMVGDLLILSRLDAQQLKLDFEVINLKQLFTEIVRQVEKITETAEVEIIVDSAPLQIKADRIRLRQVLLILIDNAVRFSSAGSTITLKGQPAGDGVQIEVIDTGRGIAAEHLPHVFDRFYQIGLPENERSRSNGLGLSIARSLIEAQGGSINIESEIGTGTRVQLLFENK